MSDELALTKRGECPNGHGKLTFFKHPMQIMYYIPLSLIDYIPSDVDDDYYGAIIAYCPECGFTLMWGGQNDE
jgi:hypothetical protein